MVRWRLGGFGGSAEVLGFRDYVEEEVEDGQTVRSRKEQKFGPQLANIFTCDKQH